MPERQVDEPIPSSKLHQRRLIAAIAITALLVLGAPLVDFTLKAFDGGEGGVDAESTSLNDGGGVGIDASSLGREGGVEGALAFVEALADEGMSGAPEAFDAEIGLLAGARDVRASGAVVGYVVDGECLAVLDALVPHMEARGWTAVALGGVDGATFVKPSGRYTWTLVTCTQVELSTSVVFRCQ